MLNYLEKLGPIQKLKMKEAAEKVVTVLALTTAQRLQSLSLINIDNIEKSELEVRIKITEQIKTTKPGAFQPEMNYLSLKADQTYVQQRQSLITWSIPRNLEIIAPRIYLLPP